MDNFHDSLMYVLTLLTEENTRERHIGKSRWVICSYNIALNVKKKKVSNNNRESSR